MIVVMPHTCDRMVLHWGLPMDWALFFIWLLCFIVWFVCLFLTEFLFIICIYTLIFVYFVHALYNIALCIICLNFFKHTQSSRLGGGLRICPITISQGLNAWNTQLIFECLLGNGRDICFNHSSQCSHTIFTKIVIGQIWDLFKTR